MGQIRWKERPFISGDVKDRKADGELSLGYNEELHFEFLYLSILHPNAQDTVAFVIKAPCSFIFICAPFNRIGKFELGSDIFLFPFFFVILKGFWIIVEKQFTMLWKVMLFLKNRNTQLS